MRTADARTIVVEPPALPVPGRVIDPRPRALAAARRRAGAVGIPDERQTILVAGGLAATPGARELEQRSSRRQRAARSVDDVLVHDAEDPSSSSRLGDGDRPPSPARSLEADLVVVTVGAAETIVHGGPGTPSSPPATPRPCGASAGADSLVEAAGAPAWELALAVESRARRRVPLFGVSLVLDHPRLTGRFRGYPHELEARRARGAVAAAPALLAPPGRRCDAAS